MVGVSVYFGDTPYSLLKLTALISHVCMDHCESWPLCKNNELTYKSCPKLTEQTIYICKYLSLQPLFGAPIYPYNGTWLNQPEWFILAYGIARNKLSKMQSERNSKKT